LGLRGPGAKPKGPRAAAPAPKPTKHPWESPRLKNDRAGRVIAFIETLPITSGVFAGKKFRLREWQKRWIRKVYRTRRGKRIVRTALLTMPRKNGKTQLVAALALCHLIGPEAEPRGQVYSAAADRDQAAIMFREMEAMIQATPWMVARCNIQRFAKKIEDLESGSVYAALSSDARKAHGLSPSFFAYDELAQAADRHLYDNLRTGGGARLEPLGIVISTQSSDPHHVMSELTDYGRKLNDGVIENEQFSATIYEASENADPWDERVWRACNPALGDFRSLADMRAEAEVARRMPSAEAAFRNLYLNQRIDPVVHFLPKADWDACAVAPRSEKLRGAVCFGGLDLALRQDLTALVLFFPDEAGGGDVLSWFWLPEEGLRDKAVKDSAPYDVWRTQGLLETTTGRVVDARAVARRCAQITAQFDLRGLAYDRWRIEEFKKTLGDEGIELPLVEYGQGYKDMAPALDAVEAEVLNHRLRHGGHAVLNWNCSNCVVEIDPAGNRKLTKDPKKSRGRIDGMVALCMAVGLAHRENEGPSIYEKQGLVVG
jgi:phage terminase large subunit-like protein